MAIFFLVHLRDIQLEQLNMRIIHQWNSKLLKILFFTYFHIAYLFIPTNYQCTMNLKYLVNTVLFKVLFHRYISYHKVSIIHLVSHYNKIYEAHFLATAVLESKNYWNSMQAIQWKLSKIETNIYMSNTDF